MQKQSPFWVALIKIQRLIQHMTLHLKKHFSSLALCICWMLILALITVATSAAGSVHEDEIRWNSWQWERLDEQISKHQQAIEQAKELQQYLEERNELLRAVFTPGENH